MSSRRDFLQMYGFCAGVRGNAAAPAIDFDNLAGFPDVDAYAHTGEALRFFEECINNKFFVVNFMSMDNATHRTAMLNLAKTVKLLGDKIGSDIFVTSITVDPYKDTVERLAEYATQLGAPKGWRFMRMLPVHSASITQRMYHHDRGSAVSQLVFYGDGRTHLWGSYSAMVQADEAVTRIASVSAKTRAAGLSGGGPSH